MLDTIRPVRASLGRALVLFPLLGSAAAAQQSTAFSALRLEVTALRGAHDVRLREHWDQGDGVAVEVSTPLPVGEIGLGIAQLPFDALRPDQPGFRGRLLTARWGIGARAGRIAARASLVGGNFLMRFDDDAPSSVGLTTESELLVGARGAVDLALGKGVGLTAGASWDRVLTRIPITLTALRVGAHVTAATPGWLREVLQ